MEKFFNNLNFWRQKYHLVVKQHIREIFKEHSLKTWPTSSSRSVNSIERNVLMEQNYRHSAVVDFSKFFKEHVSPLHNMTLTNEHKLSAFNKT